MATEQLTVTDGTATGQHTYTLAADGAALETVFDDPMADASAYTAFSGSVNAYTDAAASDGLVIGNDAGRSYFMGTADTNVAYDGTSMYEIAVRLRTVAAPTDTDPIIYAGFAGVADDGETLINSSGENSTGSQHFVALSKRTVPVSATYADYYGYAQGWGDSSDQHECTNPAAPGVMYTGVAFVRPIVYLNYVSADGTQYVDSATITRIAAPDVEPAEFTITVTGDTTRKTATTDVTITALDTDGTLEAYGLGADLGAQADIAGLTSDTAVLLKWGDGTARETVTLTDGAASATHEYAAAGTYTVSVIGTTSGAAYSNNATVGDVLPAPANLTEAAAPAPDANSFTVTWDPVDGAVGYEATVTGLDGTAVPGTVDGTTATFTALDAATDYTVTVTALSDNTMGDSSPATTVVTTTEAP